MELSHGLSPGPAPLPERPKALPAALRLRAVNPRSTWGQDENWDRMFQILAGFRAKFGNCLVPRDWVECPGLYDWILRQRQQESRKTLPKDRRLKLEGLGFEWNVHKAKWRRMYEALREYKRVYGHRNVLAGRESYSALSAWVNRQRMLRKRSKLSPDQIRLLDRIGFVWKPQDSRWERRYQELVAYCRKYGNSNVPDRWPENRGLAKWVAHQRDFAQMGSLSQERRRLLDALGFRWKGHGRSTKS